MHKNQYFFTFFSKPIDICEKVGIIKMVHEMHHEGGVYMINRELLENKIKESGMKKSYLASKCKLSRQGFYNCLVGKAMFNSVQISILCKELNITSLKEKESIFFAKCGA